MARNLNSGHSYLITTVPISCWSLELYQSNHFINQKIEMEFVRFISNRTLLKKTMDRLILCRSFWLFGLPLGINVPFFQFLKNYKHSSFNKVMLKYSKIVQSDAETSSFNILDATLQIFTTQLPLIIQPFNLYLDF